jgi:hypothetical protein
MCKAPDLNNLRRDKDDALGNDRFNRPLRHMHKAQCGRGQRDAVRGGKRSDCLYQFSTTARENNQREHEQQMIHAGQNVFEAELEINTSRL